MAQDQKKSVLAHNLRFLRKKHHLSQTALAEELGIRRSNIAAYESKNVEPRLNILLEIGNFFNIAIRTLIETKLDDVSYDAGKSQRGPSDKETPVSLKSHPEIQEFVDKSVKIHKVLEGFKAFYRFKKEKLLSENTDEVENILHDIENFIGLMEHLLHYNETIIKTLREDDGNPQADIDDSPDKNG